MPFDSSAALAASETWVFDLDNTLYPAACNLFAQVDTRMTGFLADFFACAPDEARRIQKSYFREYGATLRGMMVRHGVDPHVFMDHVHDIDLSPVAPNPRLAAALDRLPGRKLIYTNGSVSHAERVLGRLGITDRFEAVFDIVAADYRPKPTPEPYDVLVARHGIDPARAVMVEDVPRNLRPAAALGMTTVWLKGSRCAGETDDGAHAHIHHVIDDLDDWLEGLTIAPDPAA